MADFRRNASIGVLAVLVASILAHAPWRLMVLFAEALVASPGHAVTSTANNKYWQCQDLWTTLERRLGWTVKFEDLNANLYGMTDTPHRIILINSSLSWNGRYAVLAHEGGHALQPSFISDTQGEAFAESVAALVAHDGLWEHARYIARVRSDIFVLVVEWRAIYRAAAILEGT